MINISTGAISGIFAQILSSTEDNGSEKIRENCIKFLATKLKTLGRDIITKDVEDLLINECKKVLLVRLFLNLSILNFISSIIVLTT